MRFFHNDVLVSAAVPPEEILASVSGGMGNWQIAVIILGFFSLFLSEFDSLSVKNLVRGPEESNFTCIGGSFNQSPCHYVNGTPCKDFSFTNPYNVTTFTEQLKLVCENEYYRDHLKNGYDIGQLIGYLVSGVCADKIGLKKTTLIFISLQSLTALTMIHVGSIGILITFVVTHSVCASAIYLIPTLAVCDVVGNKWRTFALGVVNFPSAASFIVFKYFYQQFSHLAGVLGTLSVLPLTFLIPVLFYKDSPNYICLLVDFSKGEEVLRYIAKFNKSPMSPDAKIRPVQILIDSKVPKQSTFFGIWRPSKTRKVYLAISCIWLCAGYCTSVLLTAMYKHFTELQMFGFCAVAGFVASIALCHWGSHKIVIGVFSFLRSVVVAGIVMHNFLPKMNFHEDSILIMVATVLFFIAETAAINLTPRIFPTELRGICVGFCFGMYHVGYFTANLMQFYVTYSIWITGLVLIFLPIIEISSCFWLWDVHNRELPDYLKDCVRFKKYYKPTRYFLIYDAPLQQEIEVKVVQLNYTDLRRTSSRVK